MKDFLEKLYNEKNKLSLLLLEAKYLAEKNGDIEIANHINKEIEGYKSTESLPDYRKILGEMVADVDDVFGNPIHREYPMNFSKISEQLGIDINESPVFDSIAFLENSLETLTSNFGLKPLHSKLVEMISDGFHIAYPQLNIKNLYHKIPTSSLKFILTKVRQDLIQSFIRFEKQKTEETKIITTEIKKFKKIFITYAWTDEEFNSKVISFVNFLREKGFDAFMDKKESQEEASINFNEMMIKGIDKSDKVIVILNEVYKERADNFIGGVGTEFKIILEDMKTSKNKYIFISFGSEKFDKITPTGILGTEIIDLKKDQDENNFNILFSKIKQENILNFSNINDDEVEIKKIEIKPFKL
ncbi:SEFIR domain-containing protein [Chryseobacterium sp. FH1]|uniref:AbiTii domain-containing protein n=1 Tax=Chryseobacterium sp. FH1 TaxID=1233951 RepID=UPI0004E360C2|nr:SEFIR domain-containing protein [Chryseobacterium sp. FH1]KFC21534.1 hypothetical protein IO90_06075 [Chryseobacterium sp. FH1]